MARIEKRRHIDVAIELGISTAWVQKIVTWIDRLQAAEPAERLDIPRELERCYSLTMQAFEESKLERGFKRMGRPIKSPDGASGYGDEKTVATKRRTAGNSTFLRLGVDILMRLRALTVRQPTDSRSEAILSITVRQNLEALRRLPPDMLASLRLNGNTGQLVDPSKVIDADPVAVTAGGHDRSDDAGDSAASPDLPTA
jgi:hypothetical protein